MCSGHQHEQLCHRGGQQVLGRLVEDDDLGILGQGARDFDHEPGIGRSSRTGVRGSIEATVCHRCRMLSAQLTWSPDRWALGLRHAQPHVLGDRQVRQQRRLLVDDGQPCSRHHCGEGWVASDPADLDRPDSAVTEPAATPTKRRLSGAVLDRPGRGPHLA